MGHQKVWIEAAEAYRSICAHVTPTASFLWISPDARTLMNSHLTSAGREGAYPPETRDTKEGMGNEANPGVTEQESSLSFDATLNRLTEAIERAGLTIFARIDHAAGARGAGLVMPPTVVLIYGAAKGGTPVMLAAPQSALDLPLRVLVREDADGRTLVAFHPIAQTMRAAGVPEALTDRLEPAQALLIKAIKR
jgi:uncharacterized protein (DUF302 family)